MIKKLRGILKTLLAPEDKNVLWLKKGTLMYFNGYEWVEVKGIGGESNTPSETPTVDLSEINAQIESLKNNIASLAQSVANILEKEEVYDEVLETVPSLENRLTILENKEDAQLRTDLDSTIERVNTLTLQMGIVRTSVDDLTEAVEALQNNIPAEGVTTEEVQQTINISLEPYATKQWVTDKNYLTEHQDISNYALQSYVDNKIAELVGGAPETLDTLKEIADILQMDENATAAILTAIGNKVDAVEGKGLSTNDYTNTDAGKVSNISPTSVAMEVTYEDNSTETINLVKHV